MIISHAHQFVFVAIPKTGTHSIRMALRPHLAERDEEQVNLFKSQRLSNKHLANLVHGHITANQLLTFMPECGHYSKFSFVRNPYARLVSYAFFFGKDHPVLLKAPDLFLKKTMLFPTQNKQLWFRPQCDFLKDQKGNMVMDFIGKVETLQADYEQLCHQLGLKTTLLALVNASGHGDFRQYYDQELAEMVYTYYREDFETLNYDPSSWKTH